MKQLSPVLYNGFMQLFNGKEAALNIDEQIKNRVRQFRSGKSSVLLIVQIGENKESEKYVKLKLSLAEKLGIKTEFVLIDPKLSDKAIFEKVKSLFKDKKYSGGLIQLPLPRASLNTILELIPVEKDVDVLSPDSQKAFYKGDFTKLPPVIKALDYFITNNRINLYGERVVVIGSGFLVGKPISHYLKRRGSEVLLIDKYVRGDKFNCHLAVLSSGVPNMVSGADFTKGCHVVDFGSSVVAGKTVGDLDRVTPLSHLAMVSPSPGGMGPLTVRFLIMNFLNTL